MLINLSKLLFINEGEAIFSYLAFKYLIMLNIYVFMYLQHKTCATHFFSNVYLNQHNLCTQSIVCLAMINTQNINEILVYSEYICWFIDYHVVEIIDSLNWLQSVLHNFTHCVFILGVNKQIFPFICSNTVRTFEIVNLPLFCSLIA